jgi:hypothetical protein
MNREWVELFSKFRQRPLTVKELILELQEFNPEMRVSFCTYASHFRVKDICLTVSGKDVSIYMEEL